MILFEIDNIPIFQHVVARNPVADHVVDAGAATARKTLVVERCRDVSMIKCVVMYQAVDFGRGDPRFDIGAEETHQLHVEARSSP